ncbi:cation diffusion facilitator family transporter [Pontibacter sp. E15-1]|uniref:cation diffusion facilitator family transporter n=1 Tax=Pontibacter sp. E15-1 TaxID=2919918 RepID=UPI001F4FA322|nr:cation diffusion facilitator family transporter [Pontibacter sp. E15-1]MCJ8167612.1 cation diffusion facilitator family transporter [Pontibacter sp. E15-1]
MAEQKKSDSIKVAFLLNLAFTILELVGGLISGSIAIIADSLHDFADSLALGLGWYFERKSENEKSNERYTYGYKRFSMLSALINALVLMLGAIFIFYVSIQRILNPQMPDVPWMIGTAILAIILNGIGAWKLKSGKSLNKKVLLVHLLEDTVGWIAVLIVSILLLFFNIPVLDPILAIVVNLAVLIYISVKLVDIIKIFLQRVPEGVNVPLLEQKILSIDGVERVNHFHVWGLTEQKKVVTVHVKIKELGISEQSILKNKIYKVFDDLDTEHVTIDLQEYSAYLELLFEDHQQRLGVLDEQVRRMAVRHAERLYIEGKCTKDEALERGITQAEMELRNL